MKAVLCLVAISLGAVVTDMVGECFMAAFYLELGCTPVSADDNSTCPIAFTCPDLHPDPSMCYYRGAAYNNRAPIPQNVIQASCSQACSCSVRGAPKIDCASVDCVETFNSDEQQQCVSTFEMDSCCSTGNVCGKDAIAKLKTCEVDGKSYYEGQQFEPANTGKICVCSANWDGSVDNASVCKDINCGLELHHQDEIMGKCAPVFYGTRICPNEFQCHPQIVKPKTSTTPASSATSKVTRGLNIRNSLAECAFGNYTLRVGDEVSVDDKCMICSCKMPPFVSCNRNNDCSD